MNKKKYTLFSALTVFFYTNALTGSSLFSWFTSSSTSRFENLLQETLTELRDSNRDFRAQNQRLDAQNQRLDAVNQHLSEDNQLLRTRNQLLGDSVNNLKKQNKILRKGKARANNRAKRQEKLKIMTKNLFKMRDQRKRSRERRRGELRRQLIEEERTRHRAELLSWTGVGALLSLFTNEPRMNRDERDIEREVMERYPSSDEEFSDIEEIPAELEVMEELSDDGETYHNIQRDRPQIENYRFSN